MIRSPKSGPATTSTSAGCSAPTTVALATVVCLSALKNRTMSQANATPPGTERRSVRQVSRPPVA